MGELRKNYLLDKYVIIASERAKRPVQLKEPRPVSDGTNCPFCHLDEKAILQSFTPEGDRIVSLPNKFPAVKSEGNAIVRTDNEFFTFSDAFGFHEVLVETQKHGVELEELSLEHIKRVLSMYVERITYLRSQPNVRYVSVFKNRGIQAGASLPHSHSQIVAVNFLPNHLVEEFHACYEYKIKKGVCPYCKIIDIEKESYRKVFENEHAVCFTPYASKFPYEVWFFPKRHVASITSFKEEELLAFAELLKRVLQRLDTLGFPAYNFMLYEDHPHGEFHFHIQLAPRMSYWAGFELETGAIINTTPPELAAQFYRGEI
ncbi:MAG TPA: galactose-1-phosphate uridylyltransferase [Candidatus Nanoarchaeia archaeon]|nr:galactose-1-phosphate uridylyltransferase [Candidatus Nanoarchaeia archaeon]